MKLRKQTAAARGTAAELRAIAWLVEAGYEVAIPCNPDSRVDVVYRKQYADGMTGPWLSAQIKRTYDKSGFPTVNLVRSSGDRYDPTDATFLMAVGEEKLWAIPFCSVAHKSRLRITKKYDEFLKVIL